MLLQIKEKLNDNTINKIWNEELILDNDFEDAKFQIQTGTSGFLFFAE
jgi:hypothetical protein